MASDLVLFKKFMVEEADKEISLPNMTVKSDNELGQAILRIPMTEQGKEGETDGQKVGRYLDEICDSLNEGSGKEAESLLQETISAFTTKVKAAWDNISAIRETARELAKNMERIYNSLLESDKFVSSHRGYTTLKTDFPVFTWEGTKAMGSIRSVIANVNGIMTNDGSDPSEEINASLFNLAIFDMTKFNQIENVTLTEDARTAAIDLLKQICQNAPAGNVETVIDMVTGIKQENPVVETLSKMNQAGFAQVNMIKNIKLFDECITSWYPILELITSDQVIPVPAAKDTVKENAKKIVTILELAAYYEYMIRTTSLRDAILIQGGLVNSDQEDAFKAAGGTSKMLAEFIRFMYNDNADKIPVTGINVANIVNSAANVSEKVSKDIANVASRLAIATNAAKTSAFRITMRDHISKALRAANGNSDGSNTAMIASKVEDAMRNVAAPIEEEIRQYNINFIDASMNTIVKVQFPGSFTEHMFKELGAAYLSATEEGGNITAADIRQADAAVIAKLVCAYLVDKVVEFVPADNV